VSGHHPGVAGPDAGVPVASPVQRLDASVKVVCLVGFVLAVVVTPPRAMPAFAGYVALAGAAAVAARLPLRVLVRRMAIELPFVAFAVALPFIGTGERTDVANVSLSIAGLWSAWAIIVKATLGVTAAIVLSWSTSVGDILTGLDRLGVPRVLVVIAGFMTRYLHVLGGELRRLQVARISRGDDPRWFWQGRAVAATAGTLFVRSYERGERVQQAMLARGFTGRFPVTGSRARRVWFPAILWPVGAWAIAVGALLR
jgi:cobalt/nickel transport system permease protein